MAVLKNLAGNPTVDIPVANGVAVLTPDEFSVSRVCSSNDPVLVLDNFSSLKGRVKPYIDVDGDGKPDVGHGEIVAGVFRVTGKRVILRNLDHDGSVGNLARILGEVADSKIQLSAINLSQTIDVSFGAYSNELGLSVSVTPENIRSHREAIREGVTALMNRGGSPDYEKLGKVFEKFAARGIPILFAGGNQGPGKSNILGLLPGAISVGALKADGSKVPTSADSSLITVWRLGEHPLRRIPSGVDLDGDDVAEFPNQLLSGGESVASKYAGKPAVATVLEVPTGRDADMYSRKTAAGFKALMEMLKDGVYRTDDMITFFQLSDFQARALRGRGTYMHKSMKFNFREDAAGNLIYDPAGSGDPDQVDEVSGTSFAAPFICGGGA